MSIRRNGKLTYQITLAIFAALVAQGCAKASLNRKLNATPVVVPATLQPVPGRAVLSGGVIGDRKQTSIGVSVRGTVQRSAHYVKLTGPQGALYKP
jgi:hypothetical protein